MPIGAVLSNSAAKITVNVAKFPTDLPKVLVFTVGNGAPTSISTAFGNIVVTRAGDSAAHKREFRSRRGAIHFEIPVILPGKNREACGNGDW
jgi:hypothetical protein